MTLIVGLRGYARSGKDCVGRFLLDMEPDGKRYAFADALKVEVAAEKGITVEELEANKDEHRVDLQGHGMARRDEDPAYWIRKVTDAIRRDAPKLAVITDVRLPNEVEAVHDRGGLVVAVLRPEVGPANAHITETALNDVEPDDVIANNGDLDALREAVKAFYERNHLAHLLGIVPVES